MAVGPTMEIRYFDVVLISILFLELSKIDKSLGFFEGKRKVLAWQVYAVF